MKIKQVLEDLLPTHWDGKESVLILKDAHYQWRGMEWWGWFFEWSALSILMPTIGGGPGPFIGQTQFDYQYRNKIWDFKATAHNGRDNCPRVFLNSRDNTRKCIETYGSYGAIIAEGNVQYDDNGRFRKWHNNLKGGESADWLAHKKEGSIPRVRKSAFDLTGISVIQFKSLDELDEAIEKKIVKVQKVKHTLANGTEKYYFKYILHKGRAQKYGLLQRPKAQVNILHRRKAM